MSIKEIVLKVEDRPGELSRVIAYLYENDVNVPAFWAGKENKKATLRFITSDPEAAVSVLTGLGFKARTMDVIAAQVPDHPGGVSTILKVLGSASINIRYIYPCIQTKEAILILEVDKTAEAVKALKDNWITLCDERLYKM